VAIRVCYVISYFPPFASGAERQALAQGRELVRRGHAVHVVTHFVAGHPRDEVIEGINVHRWVTTSRAGPLFGLSFVRGVVGALRRLRREFDLVHTHQGLWEAVATGFGRGLFGRAPVLVQPASSGYYGEARELARTKGFPILRRLALRNDCFAAISADIEREWLLLGVRADRIVRMASGVDATHYRPGPSRHETALPPRPRLVFTGRLHPQKNLDVLLDAWPQVCSSVSACLMLVGGGPDLERLRRKAIDLGIGGSVEFVGQVDDAAEILRAADVFVLPSVAEGMSNSLLEAMSTGLPCLASNIGGNTDLIVSGESGILVRSAAPDSWAEAIVAVLQDPDLRARLGQRARRRVETEFALPVVVDRYLGLYERLLEAQRGGHSR
jgi:glycosyltransferase involved in cell wall biosynthesis